MSFLEAAFISPTYMPWRPHVFQWYDAAMAAGSRIQPTTIEEEALWSAGLRFVAGVDEVGRGPIAGPVLAAAVILEPLRKYDWLGDVRDSKVLPAPERER